MPPPPPRPATPGGALVTTYFLLAVGYCAYSAYAYVGPYRWFAELQLRFEGEYGLVFTFLLSFLLVCTPLFLLAAVLNRRGRPPLLPIGHHAIAAQRPSTPGQLRRAARWLILGGIALFPLGGAAGYAGRRYWKMEPLTTLNLRPGLANPASGWAEIEGIVQTTYVYRYSEGGSSEKHWAVVPVTEEEWTPERPVRFFLRTQHNRAFRAPGTRWATLERREPPFVIAERLTVERNGLPGLVRTRYQDARLRLDEPHYLLETNTPMDPDEVMLVSVLSAALLGLMGILTGFALWLRARREECAQKAGLS